MARSTLVGYAAYRAPSSDRRVLTARLAAWFLEMQRAKFASPAELKAQFANASIVANDRVVFNLKGNNYRLIAAVDYSRQSLFIKWIGTHKEYDRIDAATVEYEGGRYDNPTSAQ